MGDDEYHPISKEGTNLTAAGGIGYTVIDSIDTMLIMGLHDDYSRARDWVAKKLDFDCDANFNTFEVRVYILEYRGILIPESTDDHTSAWGSTVGVPSVWRGLHISRASRGPRRSYTAGLRHTVRTTATEH